MPSLFEQGLALFQQRIELRLLFGDAVGVPLFVRRAGIGRGLLHQLAEIVFDHLDASFDVGEPA
jgi:hypothetical protein